MKHLLSLCCFTLSTLPLASTTYTVNSFADTAAGTGTAGTLRYCLNQANNTAGPNTIQFALPGTLTLTQPLPPIEPSISSITSNGNAVIIDGVGLFNPFFVQTGASLTIGGSISVMNGASVGGAGGSSGAGGAGGGALGAGGGLFVAPSANVIVQGLTFSNCTATGGAGGAIVGGGAGGGGGGGMNRGAGGSSAAGLGAAGGGGGYGGSGGVSSGLGGGGGGGLLFNGGAGSSGGGGGGSDAQNGFAGVVVGGNGGASLAGVAGGTGGTGGISGGAGSGFSGGGGGGASGAGNGNGGDSVNGGAGGGAGFVAVAGANAGSATGSFGGGGGGAGGAALAGGQGGTGGNYAGGGGGGSGGAGVGGLGGNGGFGGGGGGLGNNAPFATPAVGNGGFGAGGGGGYTLGGRGGFGGGDGGTVPSGGGGGGAMGGTLFIGTNATLTLQDPLQSSISSGALTAGAGFNGGASGLTFGPDIFLMSSGTLLFAQSSTFTINTSIDSDVGAGGGGTTTGGITMNGSGTLVLGGTNTYTGFTALNAGVVQVSSDTNLGALGFNQANINFNGGTLSLTAPFASARDVDLIGRGTIQTASATPSTWTGLFFGSGPLQFTGTGTFAITNIANSYTGGTTLLGGTVQIAAPTNLGTGAVTFGDGTRTGTLEILSGFGAGTFSNPIHVNAPGGTIQSDIVAPAGLTLSGSITGSQGTLTLTEVAPTPITLSGVNTFSGTITQLNAAGTLKIGSTTGLLFSNLINNGALIFNQAGPAFVGGSITGTGTLTVSSGAAVALNGHSTFSGATTVQSGGGLFVAGSSTASAITVQSGGFLGGSGRVQNVTVNSGGLVQPGNLAPGVLSGNMFTFQTGSELRSFLGNNGAGEIDAAGTFTIDPGAVLNIAPQGVVTPQVSRYTLVSAGAIVGPQFTLATPLPPFILEILYSPTTIDLLVFAPPFQLQLPHGNPRNTAVCFQTVMQQAPSDLIQLNKILDLQVPSQLQHSFNQMHPANFDTIAYAGENVGERVRQIFTTHFFEQRAVSCPPDSRRGWRVWAAPFVTEVNQSGEDLFSSYKEHFTGITAAADYHHKMWLFSAGFSYASAQMHMPGGHAQADFTTSIGTLGAAYSNNSWFSDWQFAYQYSPIHAHRKMFFSVQTPSFSGSMKRKAHHVNHSNQVMGHWGGGYDIKVAAGRQGTFNFYPFTNVDYFYDLQAAYKEGGAGSLNLNVRRKQYDFLRPEGGLGLGYHGCFKSMDIWCDISASYVLEFRLTGEKTDVRFSKSSCTFDVSGLNPENNLICPEARIRLALPSSGWAMALGFHGEYGDHFIENSGQAELRKAF